MLSRLGQSLSAGLVAGSAVGAAEALWVLQGTFPAEYQALLSAVVLYGIVGGALGLALGLLLLPFGALSPARRWTSAAGLVIVVLGGALAWARLADEAPDGAGPSVAALAGVGTALVALAAFGVWLGTNLLTKTPLRLVPTLRGTVALWGGGVGMAWLFSLMPAPGAVGEEAPAKQQGADFADKPDVVLVSVDGLRGDAVAPSDGVPAPDPAPAPALAALARDAVTFDQYVVAAPGTRPATASLLTSLPPASHTCTGPESALPATVVTLAEVLQGGGYVTGGLPADPLVTAAHGFGQGFDWYPFRPDLPLGASESTSALYGYTLLRTRWVARVAPTRVEAFHRVADAQIDAALRFLDANAERRVFLFVQLVEPTPPWFGADGWPVGAEEGGGGQAEGGAERVRAAYAAEVARTDAAIGRLVEGLRQRGRYEPALVVVAADHGEELGEHGRWGHGAALYDEIVHVPLVVKRPGQALAGVHVPWQVRQIDVAPTLAVAAHLSPDASWQGADLFTDTFVEDLATTPPEPPDEAGEAIEAAAPTSATTVQGAAGWPEHPASRPAVSEVDARGLRLLALRARGLKFIENLAVPPGDGRALRREEFYDLVADPAEAVDAAGGGSADEAGMRAELEGLVERFRAKAARLDAGELDPAERARLCALGYLDGAQCGADPRAAPSP